MVSVIGLTEFFQQTYTSSRSDGSSYANGYYVGNLDVLLQRAKRNKSISQSRLWDYVRVENDPNFNRRNSEPKFAKLISKISSATTITTVVASQLHMANLTQFIPENLRNLLFNFNALADTSINLLSNFEKQIIFSQIEKALFADIEFNFLGGTITFNELVNVADSIFENMPFEESIKNDSLRPILSLGIQNLLPESMVGIFDSLIYLDLLDTIFINDEVNRNAFTGELKSNTAAYGTNKVNTVVVAANYTNQPIDFSDPMGLKLQNSFKDDLKSDYTAQTLNNVNLVGTKYNLTQAQKDQIATLLAADGATNIDNAFEGSLVGLPSLLKVGNGLSIEAYNKTTTAVNNAISRVVANVIKDAGLISTPTGTKPLDYLINIKTNLEKRKNMKKRGASSDQFVEIDSFLSSVVSDGEISESLLQSLSDRLDTILQESESV